MKKIIQFVLIDKTKPNQTFLIMRLMIYLLLVAMLPTFATGYSQSTVLKFTEEPRTLANVIETIESQTEYRIFYKTDQISPERVVDIKKADPTVAEALKTSFEGSDISYTVLGKMIVLAPAEKIIQAFKVTGTVTDESGATMPGVSVQIEGTTTGTVTDISGKYTIELPSENTVLIFSFIGYTSQKIEVKGETTINVTMLPEAQNLDQVVVIGYGSQKKVNVIGSVATITSKELSLSPVSNVSNAVTGRLPGAIVVQNTGEPGLNSSQILIRGSGTLGDNSPLVVVDGIAGRDLNSIEPSDIESLTILKDASAAIYGARAANGVILVTTKRGTDGPPKITYNFSFGSLTPTMLPKMNDAAAFAELTREDQAYLGVSESNMRFSLDDIEKYKSGEYPWTHPNTNWFDATLANHSNTHNQNLSVSGASNNISYYLSFGNHYDGGIYQNSGTSYNRYNLNANVDIKINKYFNIGFDLNGSQQNRMYSAKDSESIFESIVRSEPTNAAVYPNGLPGPDIEYGWNPVVTSSLETGFNDNKTYKSQNKVSATFKVPKVDGLSLSAYYAYDMLFGVNKYFIKPWTLYQLDTEAYLAAGNTGKEDGSAFLIPSSKGSPEPQLTDTYADSKTTSFNFSVNYEKTIKSVHNISAFIAYENSEYLYKSDYAFRRYFLSDKLPYLFAGGSKEQNNYGSVSIDSRVNYFGRLTYNYKETYLFQFTFRRDGSLRFSEENGQWGNFPGVLFGWRASNENFWKNRLSFINYFKLKASYGKLGNDKVDPFQFLSSYSFGTGTVLGNDKTYFSGLYQSSVSNPYITWEVANLFNTGFESKFLNNKLELNVDFFYQRRTEILVKRNASIPNYIGISLPDENYGIVDNRGMEVILGYTKNVGDLLVSIKGNFAYARNKIIEFDEPEAAVPWQRLTGHPQGTVLLYNTLGVFSDSAEVLSYPHLEGSIPGDIKIEDYDGDGEITSNDQVLVDRTLTPKITYGITLSFAYKNWDLSALIYGVADCMGRKDWGNYADYYTGRWTPENTGSDKPRTSTGLPYGYSSMEYVTDYAYQNTKYTRLKNLQLSYKIPKKVLKAVWLSDALLYMSGENLFLLSKRTTFNDPELGQRSNQYVNYPIMKVYSFGIKVTI